MLTRALRASFLPLARLPRLHAVTSRRTFITPTAVRLADLVQEMYLRELKNYKAPQVKPSDSEGHVQKFTVPKPPPSPEETDIANDLKAYESQQVEIEGQGGEGETVTAEKDWFEEDEEEDESVPTPH